MKSNIKWYPKASLSEIYQKTGMVFAFVSKPDAKTKSQEMCHTWVKCRDFLHDAVRCQVIGNGTSCSIYGFNYKEGTNPPIDLRKTRMLASQEGADVDVNKFRRRMKNSLLLLNHFEKKARVGLSTMREVDPKGSDKKIIMLFTSSAMWMKSPFLVSMYTFLIRLGDKELKFHSTKSLKKAMKKLSESGSSDGVRRDNDARYLKTMWDKLHEVIRLRNKLFVMKDGVHEIYHSPMDIGTFHNNCGILTLIKAGTPAVELNKMVKKEIIGNE